MGWPNPCACTPGTPENGWHERRCAECLAEERNIWRRMMDRWRAEHR